MRLERVDAHAQDGRRRGPGEDGPDRLARRDAAGFKAALGIAAAWDLSNAELATVLGTPERTLYNWKRELDERGRVAALPRDTVERISYLLGIWKDLVILFPTAANRRRWMEAPNTSVVFNGQTPKHRLLAGNVGDLYEVRRYLDGARG